MLNKALEAFGDLGDDEELGPADWPTVRMYISSLNDVVGEQVHPHTSSGDTDNLDHMNLKDIRVRFLNGKLLHTHTHTFCFPCNLIADRSFLHLLFPTPNHSFPFLALCVLLMFPSTMISLSLWGLWNVTSVAIL